MLMRICFFFAAIWCVYATGPTCQPMTKKMLALPIALHPDNADALIVQIKVKSLTKTNVVDGKQMYNAIGQVVKGFKRRSLKKGTKITFGPVGKGGGCVEIKKKQKLYVFLAPVQDGVYPVLYNPVKKTKDIKRLKKEVLCKSCKVSKPVLKKKSGKTASVIEVMEWRNETLNIMCKVKGSVKPFPKFSWYKGDVLINGKADEVDITSDKSKSNLQVTGGEFLGSADYKCVVYNDLGNDTQATKVIFAKSCDNMCSPSMDGANDYCRNSGLCCLDENRTSQFCVCPPSYMGSRCEQKVLNIPSHPMLPTSNIEKANATAILGMAAALLLVALLIVLTYFLSDRKSKRNNGSGRKQLYSLDNENPDTLSSPNTSVRALTNKQTSNATTITSATPIKEEAVQRRNGAVGGSSILNEIASSPRPSITSMNGNLKRQRLNGTAKGGSNSRKTSVPSSPHYDNVTSQSEPFLLSNGSAAHFIKERVAGKRSSHHHDDYEAIDVSGTSSIASLTNRLRDSDELVFSPQPQPAPKCKNAAVVSCRSSRANLKSKSPGLTAPLLRQCEIDDGDGDVSSSDDENDGQLRMSDRDDVTEESARCISV